MQRKKERKCQHRYKLGLCSVDWDSRQSSLSDSPQRPQPKEMISIGVAKVAWICMCAAVLSQPFDPISVGCHKVRWLWILKDKDWQEWKAKTLTTRASHAYHMQGQLFLIGLSACGRIFPVIHPLPDLDFWICVKSPKRRTPLPSANFPMTRAKALHCMIRCIFSASNENVQRVTLSFLQCVRSSRCSGKL